MTTLASQARSPTGTLHSVPWDCAAILSSVAQPFSQSFIRMTAVDDDGSSGIVTSVQFYMGNDAPSVDLTDHPAGTIYNEALLIEFDLIDTESDTIDKFFSFSLQYAPPHPEAIRLQLA